MFSTIRQKVLVVGLLILMLPSHVVSAQSISFQEKLANLSQFLLLQFDVSDILTDFEADLLLNDNTCKQLDRFAVLTAQSNLTETILIEFESLTDTERQSLVQSYQDLEIEYQFLNQIETLIKEGFLPGQEKHKISIKGKLPVRIQSRVDELYPNLATKYESRVRKPNPQKTGEFIEGDYLNCPTSWSSLKQRADNITLEVEKISKEWDALKKAFQGVKGTASDAVSPANLKSMFIDKPVGAVKKGTQDTINNFKRAYSDSTRQAQSLFYKPVSTYQQVLDENQSLLDNRSDIGSLLLGSTDITNITETVVKRNQIIQLLTTKVEAYTINQVTTQHFDYGLQSNLNLVYSTPLIIQHNQKVFKQRNQDGLLKASKQVYDRQCVVNP